MKAWRALAVISIAVFVLASATALVVRAQDVQEQTYTDAENDVHDSQTKLPVSDRPAYDLLNATIRFTRDYIELKLNVKGSIDLDGFYIFQCRIKDSTEYVFSFSQLQYIGRDGAGKEIIIDGETGASSIRLSVQRSRIERSSELLLMNVSAQDSQLRYIDVMDTSAQYEGGVTMNTMEIKVRAPELVVMKFTTRYEDSRAFKFNMDTDRNGYISLDESQKYALDIEQGLRRYVQDNTASFYDSMIYVNGESPWDLSVSVDVVVDRFEVDVPDNTSITFYYNIDYKTSVHSDGTFTLSLPINGSFLREYEAPFELRVVLLDGLSVRISGTDKALQPFIYDNLTGLEAGEEQLKTLDDKRYVLGVEGGEKSGSKLTMYVLIGLGAVVLAGIIFFLYSQKKFKEQEGSGPGGERTSVRKVREVEKEDEGRNKKNDKENKGRKNRGKENKGIEDKKNRRNEEKKNRRNEEKKNRGRNR